MWMVSLNTVPGTWGTWSRQWHSHLRFHWAGARQLCQTQKDRGCCGTLWKFLQRTEESWEPGRLWWSSFSFRHQPPCQKMSKEKAEVKSHYLLMKNVVNIWYNLDKTWTWTNIGHTFNKTWTNTGHVVRLLSNICPVTCYLFVERSLNDL